MTDEQTLNQLKTTGAIHDAVFGKPATPSATADKDDKEEAPRFFLHDCPNCGGHEIERETT